VSFRDRRGGASADWHGRCAMSEVVRDKTASIDRDFAGSIACPTPDA
jgi:hypothetical protein